MASALHQVGSLWATILFEVYWALVSKNGISLDWFNPDKINAGNIIFLKIMIGAMKFQPCNPTFLQARDAILIADEEYHSGANACPIWTAFAKRGLGSDAADKVDGFKIPAMCQPGNPSVTKISTTTRSATAMNTAASIAAHPDTSSATSVNNWAKHIVDFIFLCMAGFN